MNYRKAVKVALAENNMNQSQLADKIGVSRAYVSKMLNNQELKSPSIDFFCSVAMALNIKLSELISKGEE